MVKNKHPDMLNMVQIYAHYKICPTLARAVFYNIAAISQHKIISR